MLWVFGYNFIIYNKIGEYYEYLKDLKNAIKFYLKAKEIEELYFENLISITSKILKKMCSTILCQRFLKLQ